MARMSIMGDPRLGRRVQFDEKSRSFGIRGILPTIHKPRSYTWSTGPSINQLQTSSCVGHSIAHDAAARPVRVPNITHEIAMEVYRRALQLDPWDGEADEGTSVLAGMKAASEREWYSGYRWGFSLQDALDTLGYFGPGIAGIPWYGGMMVADSNGFIHPTGRIEGGHAILVYGVNVRGRYVKLHNSWGDFWADHGNCKLSFEDFDRLLHEQGEFCIPIKRGLGPKLTVDKPTSIL